MTTGQIITIIVASLIGGGMLLYAIATHLGWFIPNLDEDDEWPYE